MKIHSAWLQVYEIAARAIPKLEDNAARLLAAHQSRVKNEIIDYSHFHDGILQLKELSGREDFGWFVGSRIPAYGLIPSLRTYFASCATVGDAGAEALRLQAIAIPGGFTLRMKLVGHLVEYELVPVDAELEQLSVVADLIFAIVDAGNKTLVDENYEYERIFHHRVNYDQATLNQYSTAELVNNSDKIAVQIDQSWLPVAQRYASPDLVRMLRPVVDKELARIVPKEELVVQIEEHLRQCETPQKFKLKDFAKYIGQTENSVRRKLREQDLNFSDLLQNYIRTECMSYLLDPSETIDSIALRLGFSERAALERAFKRWYGLTPSQLRDQYKTVTGLLDMEDSMASIEIPPLTKTHSQLLELIDGEAPVERIAKEIHKELPLAAKLVSTANSAFYGAGKVHELTDAIGRVLGLETVRNLVQIYSLQNSYEKKLDPAFDIKRLLFSSFQSEACCRALSQLPDFPHSATSLDFINAGQFGLIGQIILASDTLQHTDKWASTASQSPRLSELLAWEHDHVGVNTYQVSSILLTHWGMSINTCRLLFACADPDTDSQGDNGLAAALRLIHEFNWQNYVNAGSDDILDHLEASLDLPDGSAHRCIAPIREKESELRSLVSILA